MSAAAVAAAAQSAAVDVAAAAAAAAAKKSAAVAAAAAALAAAISSGLMLTMDDLSNLTSQTQVCHGSLFLAQKQHQRAIKCYRDALLMTGFKLSRDLEAELPTPSPHIESMYLQQTQPQLAQAASDAAADASAKSQSSQENAVAVKKLVVPQPAQFLPILVALAHTFYDQGRTGSAMKFYEAYMDWDPVTPDVQAVYHLGQIYAQTPGRESDAEDTFLLLIKLMPCATAYLGLANTALTSGRLAQAEKAFVQAVKLDRNNASVWGMLSLFNLKMPRKTLHTPDYPVTDVAGLQSQGQVVSKVDCQLAEATKSLSNALKLGLRDHELLRRIGEGFAAKGDLATATTVLTKALEIQESPQTRLALGDVCGKSNMYEDQRQHYQRGLSNVDLSKSKSDSSSTYFKHPNNAASVINNHNQNTNRLDIALSDLRAMLAEKVGGNTQR